MEEASVAPPVAKQVVVPAPPDRDCTKMFMKSIEYLDRTNKSKLEEWQIKMYNSCWDNGERSS